MFPKWFWNRILFFTLLIWSGLCGASDFQSPRTSGLGGAGHAGPFLTETIYLNPSYLPRVPFYAMGVNYLAHAPDAFVPSSGGSPVGSNYNFSVMASTRDLPVQIGAGYSRRDDGTLIHFAAAVSLGERVSFGVGSKFSTNSQGIIVGSPDLSLSATWIASNMFRFALVVDNLLESLSGSRFYREFVFGSKVQLNSSFSLYLDPHWSADATGNQGTFGFEGGAELRVLEYFFLRTGGFSSSTLPFQALRGSGFSAGLGLSMPKVSMDYSISQVVQPQLGILHNVGISLFF
ncbi:MAG: hypothetical protein HYX41_06780 [Bdellovibrio sp.]|nr:hypothetical protein [Bdellovibrio sp.]